MLFTVLFTILLINRINTLENPIIGILSQESYLIRDAFPKADSFIAASFVKLLEAGGARVVPIWIGQDNEYYQRIVNYTNGVLFPGGGTYFNETGGYGEAAKQIYDLAVESNKNGAYYPLLGICLGMQVLAFSAMNGVDVRVDCSAKDLALPIEFTPNYNSTNLFASASDNITNILKERNITYHYHQFCLQEEDFNSKAPLKEWVILAKNKDKNGKPFVSAIQHEEFPFYGLQFHPEKSSYEFSALRPTHVPRGLEAAEIGQYFSNFFVDQCRKNNHTFPTEELENDSLIYKYTPVFSALNTSYQQLYLFNKSDYENNIL